MFKSIPRFLCIPQVLLTMVPRNISSRFSNVGEGILRGVFLLENCVARSAYEKIPGSMQTRRSRVYGQFWPV